MKKTPSMTAGKKNPKKSNYPKASPKFKIKKKKKKGIHTPKMLKQLVDSSSWKEQWRFRGLSNGGDWKDISLCRKEQ